MKTDSIIIKNKKIDVTDFNDEKVMMDIENGKYFALNEVAGRIWELIDEPIVINELVNKLLDEYEIDKKECEIQVLNYISELRSNKLVQVT